MNEVVLFFVCAARALQQPESLLSAGIIRLPYFFLNAGLSPHPERGLVSPHHSIEYSTL